MAHRYLPSHRQGRERAGNCRLDKPREDTRVDQVSDRRQLLASAPRLFSRFEIETAFLAEHGNELKPPPGVDDLA